MWSGPSSHTGVLCWHSCRRQTRGLGLRAEGTATLPSRITQAAVQEFTQPILTPVSWPSEVIFFWNRFFQNWKRAQEAGTGDLTLPVFAVSASIIFQEFFSASGFCSSAVLLCCCGFPVSLLYVEELLSCLFEDINFLILTWHRRSATSQLGFDSPQLQVSDLHSYGNVLTCHEGANGSSRLPSSPQCTLLTLPDSTQVPSTHAQLQAAESPHTVLVCTITLQKSWLHYHTPERKCFVTIKTSLSKTHHQHSSSWSAERVPHSPQNRPFKLPGTH